MFHSNNKVRASYWSPFFRHFVLYHYVGLFIKCLIPLVNFLLPLLSYYIHPLEFQITILYFFYTLPAIPLTYFSSSFPFDAAASPHAFWPPPPLGAGGTCGSSPPLHQQTYWGRRSWRWEGRRWNKAASMGCCWSPAGVEVECLFMMRFDMNWCDVPEGGKIQHRDEREEEKG